ncbi:MAG TPA: hypothetical protein V6C64_13380 [Microcoleaceae cyanobacterium]|jgi:hypothetical protein
MKKTIILIGSIILFLFVFTYGKWELLSLNHADEFFRPVEESIEQGCLIEPAKTIKVMSYNNDFARIWLKGESGSTYIARFWKSSKPTRWQLLKFSSGSNFCDFNIINSTKGGSADGFYWYN